MNCEVPDVRYSGLNFARARRCRGPALAAGEAARCRLCDVKGAARKQSGVRPGDVRQSQLKNFGVIASSQPVVDSLFLAGYRSRRDRLALQAGLEIQGLERFVDLLLSLDPFFFLQSRVRVDQVKGLAVGLGRFREIARRNQAITQHLMQAG